MKDLSIIIINYRMAHLLKSCLTSLYQRISKDLDWEVLVVNTPSEDGAETLLAREFPQARLISETRPGVALARNRGIEESKGRYILHLDSDTEVLPGSLERLVAFMDEHPEAAACGAKLISPDGTLQYSCRKFYTFSAILWRRTLLGQWFPQARPLVDHLMMDWDHKDIREVDWLQAAGFMMSRRAIEALGPFDPSYSYCFEDVDWCFRAWKAGWKIYYVADAPIIHYYQRQSAGWNRRTLEHLLSAMKFYWKHHLRPLDGGHLPERG